MKFNFVFAELVKLGALHTDKGVIKQNGCTLETLIY